MFLLSISVTRAQPAYRGSYTSWCRSSICSISYEGGFPTTAGIIDAFNYTLCFFFHCGCIYQRIQSGENYCSSKLLGLSQTLLLGHQRTPRWWLIMEPSLYLYNFLVLQVMMFVSRYKNRTWPALTGLIFFCFIFF